jgi:hypothetical protein
MEQIYRSMDMVLTPHRIVTRIIGEAMCCGVPVVAGGGYPIDFGRKFFDGKPIFGKNKTLRGFFSGLIIGTMIIGTSDPMKHFQQSEIDLLYNFAHQAAIAIGNAKLYEDSLAKIRQLTALFETGRHFPPHSIWIIDHDQHAGRNLCTGSPSRTLCNCFRNN